MFGFLSPYKLMIEIAVFGMLMAGVAYGAHVFLEHERQIGRDEIKAEYTAKENEALKAAAAETAAMQKQRDDAIDQARKRDELIKTLVTANSAASGELRDTISELGRSMSSASADAVRQSLGVVGRTLADCTAKYIDMAANAATANSDKKTLMGAWPKAAQQ